MERKLATWVYSRRVIVEGSLRLFMSMRSPIWEIENIYLWNYYIARMIQNGFKLANEQTLVTEVSKSSFT